MHSQLKCSAGYKTVGQCQKYQICIQDKLHAGQYSLFPKKVLVVRLAGCAVVSVFGSGGKQAVLLLWRESFITTGKKKVLVVCLAGCAVVSVFGSGGKQVGFGSTYYFYVL